MVMNLTATWVAVCHSHAAAVCRSSPLLQEHAALVGGAIVGALHHVGIANALDGVSIALPTHGHPTHRAEDQHQRHLARQYL